jgi:hypothetical protein
VEGGVSSKKKGLVMLADFFDRDEFPEDLFP